MDWFTYLVAGVMVYVAAAAFLFGLAHQVYQWRKAPKSTVRTGFFPKPEGPGARWLKTGKDALLFPQVIGVDTGMWVFTILFHFGLLGAFVGHLRLVQEFTPLVHLLGTKGMDRLALWGGGIMGVALLVGLVYYLIRRLAFPYRQLSVPEDYFFLFLLLLTVLLGNQMRFFGDIPTGDYQAYVKSLLAFQPAFPASLASSPTRWALVFHVLSANLLLICFPFGKLVHMIAAFPANLAKRA